MKKFKEWIENYWYHYKWQTLIVAFFVITFAIGFGQIAFEKLSYDVYTLYTGGTYLQKETHDEIVEVLKAVSEKVAGEEAGEEEKDVNFQMMIYLSDERVAELQEEYRSKGETFTYDFLQNESVYDTFVKQLVSGENIIMFLEPTMYSTAEENEALYGIKELMGRDIPGTTDSGYGIILGESGFKEKYPAFEEIPDDTVICFRKVTHVLTMIGKSESQKSYDFQLKVAKELFSGIGE